jgi:predicted MFS family arabinose efflux permease
LFVLFFGSFGLFYVNASLLGYSRGFTALLTGIAILPLVVPMAVGARFVPALASRLGLTSTLAIAFLTISGGLVGLSTAAESPYWIYATWLFLVGIGFALALPILTVELNSALPAHQAGLGGGLQSATTQLGSAIGVAIVGSVLTAVFSANLPIVARDRHTVAEALAAAPRSHDAIIHAYITGASTALQAAGVATLIAGAVVVVVAKLAGRNR